jgi:GTP-binding protein Era
MAPSAFRFGLVAVIGKPNVGKSTLVNALVGQKVSIVSAKPQTTRRRVLGIVNGPNYQIGLVDTPGIHEPHTRLGKAMVESARHSLGDVDLILVVCDASKKPEEIDEHIAGFLDKAAPVDPPAGEARLPRLLCLNKMDRLKPEFVVPQVEAYTELFKAEDYMLTVATKATNLDKLLEQIVWRLPEGEARFGEDDFTDQSSRFLVAELIRERILLETREEVPHATAIRVDEWEEGPELIRISASVVVEKPGQRAILIGKGGQFLKKLGTEARVEIEEMLGQKVYLELHVVAKDNWRMNPRMLAEMEYGD